MSPIYQMSPLYKAKRLKHNNTENKEDKDKKRKKLEDFGIKYKNQDIFEALEVFFDSTNDETGQQKNSQLKQENNETPKEYSEILEQDSETLEKDNKTLEQDNNEVQQKNDETSEKNNEIKENLKKIPERLIEALRNDDYLINKEKWRKLHQEIIDIKSSENDKALQNEKIQNVIEQLSSEELLGLFFYAYVYSFRKTQIIDGNDMEELLVPELYEPMPEKPKDLPKKPQKKDFSSKDEYDKELKEWNEKKVIYDKDYEKRSNRSYERKRKEDALEYFKKYAPEDVKKAINQFLGFDISNSSAKSLINTASPLISRYIIPHILEFKYNPNILDMSEGEERELKEVIKNIRKGQKYIIMVNHDTFANIPAVIIKIMKTAQKLGIKDINKLITTVIGDLIMCNDKQESAMNSLSNITSTSPTTSKIKGGNPIARQRRENTTNYINKILSPENDKGRVVIWAPSGTRDVIHRVKNGEYEKPYIFIPDETQISNKITFGFMRDLSKQGVKVLSISTNTAEIKKPDGDTSTNNYSMNKGKTVTMHLNQFDINKVNNERIINLLANGITYANPSNEYIQEPCGIKVPSDIFDYIKALTKTTEYSKTGRLPTELFINEAEGLLNFELIRKRIKEQKELKNKAT